MPNYVVGIIISSLRYHNLYQYYIHSQLKQIWKRYKLRVLLAQVDVSEPQNVLKHVTRIYLLADLTLMLPYNSGMASRIAETSKMYENKPPELIM